MGSSEEDSEFEAFDLETEKARKFLRLLQKYPFVALILKHDGTVEIFSKEIKAAHVSQLREIMVSMEHGETDG